jgi:hypothetical protein
MILLFGKSEIANSLKTFWDKSSLAQKSCTKGFLFSYSSLEVLMAGILVNTLSCMKIMSGSPVCSNDPHVENIEPLKAKNVFFSKKSIRLSLVSKQTNQKCRGRPDLQNECSKDPSKISS